eukprot:354222_1
MLKSKQIVNEYLISYYSRNMNVKFPQTVIHNISLYAASADTFQTNLDGLYEEYKDVKFCNKNTYVEKVGYGEADLSVVRGRTDINYSFLWHTKCEWTVKVYSLKEFDDSCSMSIGIKSKNNALYTSHLKYYQQEVGTMVAPIITMEDFFELKHNDIVNVCINIPMDEVSILVNKVEKTWFNNLGLFDGEIYQFFAYMHEPKEAMEILDFLVDK